ncbi:MAG TPA: hypothetical protein IAC15_11290 [Candidatus Onthomonas avicola]|nr:hypothetical protein [Candidatus Onthomonas avicola]
MGKRSPLRFIRVLPADIQPPTALRMTPTRQTMLATINSWKVLVARYPLFRARLSPLVREGQEIAEVSREVYWLIWVVIRVGLSAG